jgi:hypothetical protein
MEAADAARKRENENFMVIGKWSYGYAELESVLE